MKHMMPTHLRAVAVGIAAVATLTGLGLAQGPPPGAPPGGQPPQGGGGRRGGFTQFTRPLASPDVLLRGKSLYDTNCASCHAVDLRGTADGRNPNLLRSGTALNDKQGELVAASIAKHTPPIILVEADSVAVAEYIHSIHATMGGQGSPPGRNPTNVTLNVLVGDATAGEAVYKATCSTCHSLTGDLKGIGSKYPDPRALQNAWVSGNIAGGGRGGTGVGSPATVTMADGSTVTGALVRKDDWLVILTLPDGTRKSIARNNGIPKVDITDPQAAHKKMALEIDDPANKKMYDVTAYLWTLK